MLTPAATDQLLTEAARLLADDFKKDLGTLGDWFLIDLGTVAQITGLTRKAIRKTLPVTETSPRIAGVRFGHLKAYLEKNTTYPKPHAA